MIDISLTEFIDFSSRVGAKKIDWKFTRWTVYLTILEGGCAYTNVAGNSTKGTYQ